MTNKPFTLEELDRTKAQTVFLEYKHPQYSGGIRRTAKIKAFWASPRGPNRALYGKTWRCWEAVPSEEETRKEGWEG